MGFQALEQLGQKCAQKSIEDKSVHRNKKVWQKNVNQKSIEDKSVHTNKKVWQKNINPKSIEDKSVHSNKKVWQKKQTDVTDTKSCVINRSF